MFVSSNRVPKTLLAAVSIALLAPSAAAWSASPAISPAAEASKSADRNDARWADLEAQARITDGDYDGAVQAEKQAEAAREKADQRESAARAARRP